MDPSKTWNLCLCVSEDESVLMDDIDMQLKVIKGMLMPRDKHVILHNKDLTSQKLVFVSIFLFSPIILVEFAHVALVT